MKAKCLQNDANGKPTFRYVPACETNVALTIKRELKRLAEEAAQAKVNPKVAPIRKLK